MGGGRITRYKAEQYYVTSYTEADVLEPDQIHADWENYVSQRSIRSIVVAPQSRHMWLATWGGVLSWNRKEELLYRRYSSEHGMAGNAVDCICLDHRERPWVGHDEGGLSYFDVEAVLLYDIFFQYSCILRSYHPAIHLQLISLQQFLLVQELIERIAQ